MFFYQKQNSIGSEIYNAFMYRNFSFHLHMHKGYELIHVLDGEIFATVAKKSVTLKKGDWMLILPYLQHSCSIPPTATCFIAVFAGEYVNTFTKKRAGWTADGYTFTCDEKTNAFLEDNLIGNRSLSDNVLQIAKPEPFILKSCLYAVCSKFETQHTFTDNKTDNSLVQQIINYLENNFTQDVSLYDMSVHLGRNYEYISRVLNQTFGANFKTLINQYRCERAEILMRTTDKTISEIALESGFQSIRSFNRVFLSITGKIPSDIEKNRN